jgi:manganese-dependent inorganic pyrophosphatase
MDDLDEGIISHYEILFDNLLGILGGRKLGGDYKYSKLCGALYIGTIPADAEICDKDIIITGSFEKAAQLVREYDFGCVILVEGTDPAGLEDAKCAIISVDDSIFRVISLLRQAVSVGSMMNTGNIIVFRQDSYVDEVIQIMRSNRFRNFPIVNDDGTLYGVLSRRHVMGAPVKKVIMVDHNERSQSVDGLEQADIIEIIDHHRIADIQTDAPLFSRLEPVGCTATIVYKIYKENSIEIPKDMAGLMLSAILSDTLNFSSPTCTAQDKAAGEALAEIAGVGIDDYAKDMFRASTNLDKMSVEQMLNTDLKRFKFGDAVAYIAQINVTDFNMLIPMQDEIQAEMIKLHDESEAALIIFMITDIVHNGSLLFACGQNKPLADRAFNMCPTKTHIFLPGILSRKKQIVPTLTQHSAIGIV